MKFATTVLVIILAAVATAMTVAGQVNIGAQKPEATLPFTMTTVTTLEFPWRIAFLPDGRMLITEKVGPVWLVSQSGDKILVAGTPAVYWSGQSGMQGVFLSPHYATDQMIYLTYAEPGDYGGGLALARAKLNATANSARLSDFTVIWRQMPKGMGGRRARRSRSRPTDNIYSSRWATVSASPPHRIPISPRARFCGSRWTASPRPATPTLTKSERPRFR